MNKQIQWYTASSYIEFYADEACTVKVERNTYVDNLEIYVMAEHYTDGESGHDVGCKGKSQGVYAEIDFTVEKIDSSVTKAPEPTNPTYNGSAQALVTEGAGEGGTMQYSLDGNAWSADVPTGTEAKAYTVWYKVAGDANHNDTAPQSVTSTITGSAPVKVTFDANGGTGTMDQLSVEAGHSVVLTANAFKRDGYTFSGWNTAKDGSGTAYADMATVTPTSDLTLYAQWKNAASQSSKTTSRASLPPTGDPAAAAGAAALALAGTGLATIGTLCRRRR